VGITKATEAGIRTGEHTTIEEGKWATNIINLEEEPEVGISKVFSNKFLNGLEKSTLLTHLMVWLTRMEVFMTLDFQEAEADNHIILAGIGNKGTILETASKMYFTRAPILAEGWEERLNLTHCILVKIGID